MFDEQQALNLSIGDIVEVLGYGSNAIDAQFQFWITVTFAAIVAAYLAGPRLSLRLKVVASCLYLLVSVLLALRTAQHVLAMNELIRLSGYAGGLFEHPLTLPIAMLRGTIWLIGTGTTIAFLFRPAPPETSHE